MENLDIFSTALTFTAAKANRAAAMDATERSLGSCNPVGPVSTVRNVKDNLIQVTGVIMTRNLTETKNEFLHGL